MSNSTQSSNRDKGQTAVRRVPLLLPTTAIASSVVPRTLTLIATISLVAFAFYMTRPETNLSSVSASGHASQPEKQQDTSPAAPSSVAASGQGQPASSESSNKSAVTVNGKDIPVPDDGNLNQTIHDGDSTTTVHISSDGSGSSSSSVHVESNSSSSSSSSSSDSGT
jgi:hypothetical protein